MKLTFLLFRLIQISGDHGDDMREKEVMGGDCRMKSQIPLGHFVAASVLGRCCDVGFYIGRGKYVCLSWLGYSLLDDMLGTYLDNFHSSHCK
jgi:hypothetical protein